MQVQVVDRLATICQRVDHHAIPLVREAFLTRDGSCGVSETTDDGGVIQRVQIRDVALRNHENVLRRLGIDIAKRERIGGLVDDIRRDLFANDLAKQAGCFVSHNRARTRPRAMTPAVSKRRVWAPTDTGTNPERSKSAASSSSMPPSGPSASVIGAAIVVGSGGAPPVSKKRVPDACSAA